LPLIVRLTHTRLPNCPSASWRGLMLGIWPCCIFLPDAAEHLGSARPHRRLDAGGFLAMFFPATVLPFSSSTIFPERRIRRIAAATSMLRELQEQFSRRTVHGHDHEHGPMSHDHEHGNTRIMRIRWPKNPRNNSRGWARPLGFDVALAAGRAGDGWPPSKATGPGPGTGGVFSATAAGGVILQQGRLTPWAVSDVDDGPGGSSRFSRQLLNALFSLATPLGGRAVSIWPRKPSGGFQRGLPGLRRLAFCAGTFLCIASSGFAAGIAISIPTIG